MRIGSLVKRSFLLIGAWDSAIVSLSGFLTNLLAGRFLAVTDFGLFTTAFIVVNMAVMIQASFTSGPYAILGPRVPESRQRTYLAACTWITGGTSLAAGVFFCAPMYFFYRKGVALGDLPAALAAFAFYVLTAMLQDFARRACYVHAREHAALLLDVISAGGQVTLLIIFRSQLTLNRTVLIVSWTTVLGLLAVYLGVLRDRIIRFELKEISRTARENYVLGKWIFVTSGVSWIANQVYLLAVAAFQTPVVMAQLSVARTIAATSNPAVMTVDNMGTPRASRLAHEKGNRALRGFIGKITILGAIPFVLLGATCFIFPDQTVHFMFHRSFGNIRILVRIFSLMPFLWFASRSIMVGINALKQPRAMLPVYAIGACVTVTIGVHLARQYGALGAACGLLFNSILLVAGFAIQFLRISRPEPEAAEGELSGA